MLLTTISEHLGIARWFEWLLIYHALNFQSYKLLIYLFYNWLTLLTNPNLPYSICAVFCAHLTVNSGHLRLNSFRNSACQQYTIFLIKNNLFFYNSIIGLLNLRQRKDATTKNSSKSKDTNAYLHPTPLYRKATSILCYVLQIIVWIICCYTCLTVYHAIMHLYPTQTQFLECYTVWPIGLFIVTCILYLK